jgi:prepilin-type N-terminal cleavage/methylation domain-containing protein
MFIKKGFTMIEVLIVVAILAILSVTGIVTLSKQRTKAEDVAMKTDLDRLKVAFEDYYNDHNCYPPPDWFDGPEDAGSELLRPYLSKMLYNKKTDLPYVLEKDSTGCRWFKLYTTLNNAEDPQAVILRTTDLTVGSTLGNYGVSSSNTTVRIYYNPTGPSSPPNRYYCQGPGNCSQIPGGVTCTPSYSDPSCGATNLCATITSTCQ